MNPGELADHVKMLAEGIAIATEEFKDTRNIHSFLHSIAAVREDLRLLGDHWPPGLNGHSTVCTAIHRLVEAEKVGDPDQRIIRSQQASEELRLLAQALLGITPSRRPIGF